MAPACSSGMPSFLARRMARNQPTIIDVPSITPYEWMGTGGQGWEDTAPVGTMLPPRNAITAQAPASRERAVDDSAALGSGRRRSQSRPNDATASTRARTNNSFEG